MLFISPPFGNYLNLPYTKSIIGSVTIENRPGLIKNIIKTLHYSQEYKGWINKIGLKNKGIDYVLSNYNLTNKILSIAILEKKDIPVFNKKIPTKQDLEINISCPNVDKSNDIIDDLHIFLHKDRKWCAIKISPITTDYTLNKLYSKGFRQFHCCNTLPLSNGGLSGEKLIPYNLSLINRLKQYKDVEIVAGGGIKDINILRTYKDLGANHFSISTICFDIPKFILFYFQYLLQN